MWVSYYATIKDLEAKIQCQNHGPDRKVCKLHNQFVRRPVSRCHISLRLSLPHNTLDIQYILETIGKNNIQISCIMSSIIASEPANNLSSTAQHSTAQSCLSEKETEDSKAVNLIRSRAASRSYATVSIKRWEHLHLVMLVRPKEWFVNTLCCAAIVLTLTSFSCSLILYSSS